MNRSHFLCKLIDSNFFFIFRSLSLCCCRLSPGIEVVSRKKMNSSREVNKHDLNVIPRRTLIGSIIPNPLNTSRRRKYSERRLLG